MTPAQQQIVMALPIDYRVGGSGLLTGLNVQGPAFDGAGFDFSYPDLQDQCRIRDTATIANDFRGSPGNKLTYTSPSVKLCRQADGVYRFGNHNIALQSQTFNTSPWTAAAVSVTANNTIAPDGTATGDLITVTGASHNIGNTTEFTVASGVPMQASCYVKTVDVTWLRLYITDIFATSVNNAVAWFNISAGTAGSTANQGTGVVLSASITAAANGWYRIVVNFTSIATTAAFVFAGVTADAGSTRTSVGTAFSLWGAELKRLSVQETVGGVGPVGYLPTTTAAVYGLPYEWDAPGIPLGLRIEVAATNLCLRASDFTNASWTKVTMTTAKTATGPDGVANSASTLTASGANATALQAITSASASRITSMFVKRRTGSGTVNITQDNGTTWTAVTVTSEWTRVQSTNQTLTNPTVGIRIVTSADAVDVALFQHELGAFITTPVETISASVTRAVDNITLATSALPFSATVGSLYAKFNPINTAAIRFAAAIDAGAAERFAIGSSAAAAGYFSVIDGSAEQVGPLTAGTVTASADNKVAAGWVVNRFEQATNSVLATVDTSGTLPTVTSLIFGVGGSAASPLNGWLSQLAYYKRTMADVELQTLTRIL